MGWFKEEALLRQGFAGLSAMLRSCGQWVCGICLIYGRAMRSSPQERSMAEREGFEPPVPCGTPDFESGAIDHSATSP